MKPISRLLTILFAILNAVPALAGFKGVPFNSGVAFAPTTSVSGSISTAGGGVILRDIATCNSSYSDTCNFSSVNISVKNNYSTIHVTNGEDCTANYKTEIWAVKNAIDLVASETDEVFRNINLLGKPTYEDIDNLFKHEMLPFNVWYIEVSPSLAQTKAGETLLTLDLLLTDLQQYATNLANANKVKGQLASKGVANWTWTDEKAHSIYSVSCKDEKLSLSSNPGFTFLDQEKNSILFPDEFENLINEMNPNLINSSVEFAKVAAFFRHVRDNYPSNWSKIKSASRFLPSQDGETPRLLLR